MLYITPILFRLRCGPGIKHVSQVGNRKPKSLAFDDRGTTIGTALTLCGLETRFQIAAKQVRLTVQRPLLKH